MGELTLVREAGACSDRRQREVVPFAQELLRSLDAAGDHVLVRGQPGGRLELPGKVVRAEVGGRSHLLQGQGGVNVSFDVLDDGAKPGPRQHTVHSTGRALGRLNPVI